MDASHALARRRQLSLQRRVQNTDSFVAEATANSIVSLAEQIVNEPTVGLYFINQHIRQTLPELVEETQSLVALEQDLKLRCADADDAAQTLAVLTGPVHQTMGRVAKRMANTLAKLQASLRESELS